MGLELKDCMRIIKRRLWLVVLIVAAAVAAAWLYSEYMIEPVYQASTKLIVNEENKGANQTKLDLNSVDTNIMLVDTYKEIIETPAIMDIVASRHPEFHLTSDQLIGKVQVSSVNNTQVMTVSVTDPSYKKAAEIVNAVSAVFQQQIPSIMNVDNVTILNKASETKRVGPINLNQQFKIAISIVIGLMIGLGIAFLLEYMDDSVKTEEDVALWVELPTLATISQIKRKDIDFDSPSISKTINKVGDKSYAGSQ